jgi:hypothetical protein
MALVDKADLADTNSIEKIHFFNSFRQRFSCKVKMGGESNEAVL